MLALEQSRVVDSGSEEEEEEEEGNITALTTAARTTISTPLVPSKSGAGFCNCSLM